MNKIIIILFAAVFSVSSFASNLPDFPFVVSSGKATEEVKPDIASIHIQLESYRESSVAALDDANAASEEIFEILKKFDIEKSQLEAGDLQKDIKRKRDEQHNSLEILGYEVGRRIIIKLTELNKYSDLMNELAAIDNLAEIATSFDVRNREAVKSALTAKASAEARSHAEEMAKGLGVRIDSVYAISSVSDFGNFFATFGAQSAHAKSGYAPRTSAKRTVMFIPKSISISTGINVVFRIKN